MLHKHLSTLNSSDMNLLMVYCRLHVNNMPPGPSLMRTCLWAGNKGSLMKTEWLLLTWFPGREDSGWRAKTRSCPISAAVWSVAGLHQGSFNILTTLAQYSFSAVLPPLTLKRWVMPHRDECPLLKCPLVPSILLQFSISSGLC